MGKLSELSVVARIAQVAARQEVVSSMRAHQRFNPSWEIAEVAIHYAIRASLLAHFQASSEAPPRVAVECGEMSNVDFSPDHKRHCVDVAVLHPIVEAALPNTSSGYAWADQNKAALGLIEVKIDWWTNRPKAGTVWDAELLDMASASQPQDGLRPLEWVMLVVFFAGQTKEEVGRRAKRTEDTIAPWGLHVLTQNDPSEAPSHPGSAGVDERWFEIMCYGKVCSRYA